MQILFVYRLDLFLPSSYTYPMAAVLLIPTATGGRKRVHVSSGGSVHYTLVYYNAVDAAARWGLERKEGTTWVYVPPTYVVRPNDELRVAFPPQKSSAASGIVKLLTTFVQSLRRKPNAHPGIRTRKK